MNFTRRDNLFIILAGFFITNAILGEIIGIKTVDFGFVEIPIGIIPWPIVFLTTDILNEFYGKKAVQRLSFITAGLIVYLFIVFSISIALPGADTSAVDDVTFKKVLGSTQWIMIGSVVAFLVSQLLDVFIFRTFKNLTKGKLIWLRATGSTVISQLFDTFIIQGIAFLIPGIWTMDYYLKTATESYVTKLVVAVLLTPLIYLGHYAIKGYLKKEKAR